jgi:class 3 adenylate cyclase
MPAQALPLENVGLKAMVSGVTAAAWGRLTLTLATWLYVCVRFGWGIGGRVLPAALAIVILELVRIVRPRKRLAGVIIDSCAAALQPVVLFVVCFAHAPLGFGGEVPGRVMIDTQIFVLALCFLASNADAANPGALWSSAGAILLAWLGVRVTVMSEPGIVSAATMRVANYKTPMSFVTAVHGPHFFNATEWQASFVSCVVMTAALGLGLFRTRRLARMAADAEMRRSALAAFFSPQVTEEILKAKSGSIAPRNEMVAVLDCDLVGFTALAEPLPPESVAAVLRAWRAIIEDAVFAEEGALLSHTGDGAIALFGFAGEKEDCVSHAVAAAKRIIESWSSASRQLPAAPKPAIGIAYGEAQTGLLGERMLSFLAAGPALDEASNLQRETRAATTPLLIGDEAFERMKRRNDPACAGFEPFEAGGLSAWKQRAL